MEVLFSAAFSPFYVSLQHFGKNAEIIQQSSYIVLSIHNFWLQKNSFFPRSSKSPCVSMSHNFQIFQNSTFRYAIAGWMKHVGVESE